MADVSKSTWRRAAADLVRHPWRLPYTLRCDNLRLLADAVRTGSFTTAYERRMDRQARADAQAAVGGWGRGIGELQRDYLFDTLGIDADTDLLDCGCGNLRAGRYFIEALEPGRYTGMDISREVLDDGRERVGPDRLRAADARLVCNDDLRFQEFRSDAFDVVWANSLVTHLPEPAVSELFAHVPSVLRPGGRVLLTHVPPGDGTDHRVDSPQTYRWSSDGLDDLTTDNLAQIDTPAYDHPGGQCVSGWEVDT